MRKKKEVIDKEIFRQAGHKGGSNTAKTRTHDFYVGIGLKGASARWKKETENTETIPQDIDPNSVK